MPDVSVPYRFQNVVGEWPDAEKWMKDFDALVAMTFGSFISNGGQETWGTTTFTNPANGVALSTGWTLEKTGTALATADISREATIFDTETYAMKVNITGAGSSNSILAVKQAAGNLSMLKGYTVVFGARVRAATASKVRLRIDDGITTAYSSYHSGGGSYELLTVRLSVAAAAAALTGALAITSDFTGAVYFDSAFLYLIPSNAADATLAGLSYQPVMERLVNFLATTGGTMSGAIAMGGNKITGLGAATVAGEALRWEQLFTAAPADIAMNSHKVSGLTDGSANGEALNYKQAWPGFRNKIINGEMRIDQANAGAAVTVATAVSNYCVDQFAGLGMVAAGVFTLQRSTATPPAGFTHFLRATCTTADAAIAAGDLYIVRHYIEGNNIRDFQLGSASAVTFTLSFRVRSSLTGTYTGAMINSAGNRSYPFEYTINVANTWETKTVTVVGDTSGTWLTDTGIGMSIDWGLAVGSTYQATANVWAAGNLFGTANQVNFMSSNTTRTWDLTGVQLEIGSVATPFEYRPQQVELALCQRYYEISTGYDLLPSADGGTCLVPATAVSGSAMNSEFVTFRASKRIAPSMTLWEITAHASGQSTWKSTAGTNTNRTTTVNTSNANGFSVTATTTDPSVFLAWAADARF